MDNRSVFQPFARATPLITLQGVNSTHTNDMVKKHFQQFRALRARVVYRNGVCKNTACVEFENKQDALDALEFISRSPNFYGVHVKAHLATDSDREWFKKKRAYTSGSNDSHQITPRSPEHVYHQEVQIPPRNYPENHSYASLRYREPVMDPRTLQGNFLETFTQDQLEKTPFVIIAVERSVNINESPAGDLVFPYEIAMIKFYLNQISSSSHAIYHRILEVSIPETLTASTFWCTEKLGSPPYTSNSGEKNFGIIWREICDFLSHDMRRELAPILIAKGPHVCNSTIFSIAKKSGLVPGLTDDFVPPFGYAHQIEDLIIKLFYIGGKSILSSEVQKYFAVPNQDQFIGLKCNYHESEAPKRGRCALASCKLLLAACNNVFKFVEL